MSSTASSTGTDYTIYVFPIRPSDTCTFMMELYNALFNSMDIIQRMAKVIFLIITNMIKTTIIMKNFNTTLNDFQINCKITVT